MKRIFICSPYRSESEEEHHRNIEYARELARQVIADGNAPYAPHLYLPYILDDGDTSERQKGIAAGMAFMQVCDEVLVGNTYGITHGMQTEIAYAIGINKPVKYTEKSPKNVTFFIFNG